MIDAALKAIADPAAASPGLVRDDELTAGAIAAHFDVTRPAISQHLAVLRAAGLVVERRDGTRRWYHARPDGTRELRPGSRRSGTTDSPDWPRRPNRRNAMDARSTTADATTIEREVRIAARPETVFPYFTDPERMRRWMGRTISLDPRPGGALRIDYNGEDIVARHVRRGRSASARRLHLGLGGGRRPGPARRQHRRGRPAGRW